MNDIIEGFSTGGRRDIPPPTASRARFMKSLFSSQPYDEVIDQAGSRRPDPSPEHNPVALFRETLDTFIRTGSLQHQTT